MTAIDTSLCYTNSKRVIIALKELLEADIMEKTNEKTICFTGHRPQSLPFGSNEKDPRCVRLKEIIKTEVIHQITENNAVHFISGMAIGTDVICADIVLELKKEYPHITLECALPCENQSLKWRETDRDRYYSIIEHCDKETLLQMQYTPDCMQKRNVYMADSSDTIIAVWNGKPSGTGNTVKYAQSRGKEVIIINPAEL